MVHKIAVPLAVGLAGFVAAPCIALDSNGLAAMQLDQKAGRAYLAVKLEEFCTRQDHHLNYIKSVVRPAGKGAGIFCLHAFYTKHGLSAGARGPALERWIDEYRPLLNKHGVTRVGIRGTGR